MNECNSFLIPFVFPSGLDVRRDPVLTNKEDVAIVTRGLIKSENTADGIFSLVRKIAVTQGTRGKV
jgi:hypothetical protein